MRRTTLARTVVEMPLPAAVEEMRLRALERLYLRRDAVDALIRSLDGYAAVAAERPAPCVPISAPRKCS
jgi:hypothetical protein